MAWFVQLIIAIGLQILGFLLRPKPKGPKPPSLEDLGEPTSEAGRPIPVVFGTVTIKSPNAIWHGDRSIRTRKAEVGKK